MLVGDFCCQQESSLYFCFTSLLPDQSVPFRHAPLSPERGVHSRHSDPLALLLHHTSIPLPLAPTFSISPPKDSALTGTALKTSTLLHSHIHFLQNRTPPSHSHIYQVHLLTTMSAALPIELNDREKFLVISMFLAHKEALNVSKSSSKLPLTLLRFTAIATVD